jgi:hypothetical protein
MSSVKLREAAKLFEKYDAKTNKKMAEHNKEGGSVRSPVRTTKGASKSDQYDRAKFIYRKASQALTANHPLKDEQGRPTPAAMQFKRWAAKVPQNEADLRELKSLGARLKERYKPKD